MMCLTCLASAALWRRHHRYGGGNDRYKGGSVADDIIGGAGNDTLLGNAGDDTITGGSGSDSLSGGDGNDVLQLGDTTPGNDTFVGDPGTDLLRRDIGPSVSIGRLVLDVAASVEELDFNGFALSGTNSGDYFDLSRLQTYLGGRTIDLLDGNDTFKGAMDADDVIGGPSCQQE
jgi:Ca2+-binding RTX toxin-like protein